MLQFTKFLLSPSHTDRRLGVGIARCSPFRFDAAGRKGPRTRRLAGEVRQIMFNRKDEFSYVLRYSLAGVINAIVGLGSIFLLMDIGVSAVLANLTGYALALSIAFVVGKTFVFRSKGRSGPESVRYLIAFLLSFLCNLAVLQLALKFFEFRPWVSQGLAIASYVVVMYLCGRLFVFSPATQQREY